MDSRPSREAQAVEPRTEAGRALLALLVEEGAPSGAVPVLVLNILAIEAEATERAVQDRVPDLDHEPRPTTYARGWAAGALSNAAVVHVGDPDDRARSYNDGFDEALRQYGIDPAAGDRGADPLQEALDADAERRPATPTGRWLLDAWPTRTPSRRLILAIEAEAAELAVQDRGADQDATDDEALMALALAALNDPEALGERAKQRLRRRLATLDADHRGADPLREALTQCQLDLEGAKRLNTDLLASLPIADTTKPVPVDGPG